MFFQSRFQGFNESVRNLLTGPHEGAPEGSNHGSLMSPRYEKDHRPQFPPSVKKEVSDSQKSQKNASSNKHPWLQSWKAWVRLKLKHHRLSLYEPSTHQKAWSPRPHHVSFSGTLWVDLTMVGVLYRLDEFFLAGGYQGDTNGIWAPFFILLALYDAWEVRTWLQSEFRTKGISFFHSVLSLVSWLLIALLGASIPYNASGYSTTKDESMRVMEWAKYDQSVFAYLKLAHGTLRVISYFEIWRFSKSKRARSAALPRLITYACGTLVLVIAPILIASGVKTKWVVFVYLGSFLTQKFIWHFIFVWDFRGMRTKADERAMVNLPFIIARLRDWNQLQLGSSILGLITSADVFEKGESQARYVVAITGFLYIAFLDMLTYAAEPVVFTDHALLVGGFRSVLWYDLFILLTMGFMGIAVGLRYVFQTPVRTVMINADLLTTLGVCAAAVIVIIVFQEALHKSKEVINTRRRVWIFKAILGATCLIAPLLIVYADVDDGSLYWITLNLCLSTLATLILHAVNGGFRREIAKKTKIRLRGHLLAVLVARKWLLLYRRRQEERRIDFEYGRVNPKLLAPAGPLVEELDKTVVEEETLLESEDLSRLKLRRFMYNEEDEDEDDDEQQPKLATSGDSSNMASESARSVSQRRRTLNDSSRDRTTRFSIPHSSVSDAEESEQFEGINDRPLMENSLASSFIAADRNGNSEDIRSPVVLSNQAPLLSEPPLFLPNALANNMGSRRTRFVAAPNDPEVGADLSSSKSQFDATASTSESRPQWNGGESQSHNGLNVTGLPPRRASDPPIVATLASFLPGASRRSRAEFQGTDGNGRANSVGESRRSRPWELLMSSRRRRRLKKEELDSTANNAVTIRVLTKILNDQFYEKPHLLVEQDIFAEYTLSWSDLFLDIIFIGVAFRLGNFLLLAMGVTYGGQTISSSVSKGGSIYAFICLFYAIFNLWWSKLQFSNKCGVADVFHKFLDVGQGLLVIVCALNITSPETLADPSSNATLVISALISGFHLSLLFLWTEVLFSKPKDITTKSCALRNIRRQYLALFAMFLALLACGLGASLEIVATAWALSFFVPFAERFLTVGLVQSGERAPFLLRYVLHRVGDGNMILLGEGVFQIIRSVSQAYNPNVFLDFSLSFLIMSAVRIALFEMDCFDNHASKHVVLRSRLGHILIMFIRCVASPAIVCIGVGLKVVVGRSAEPAKAEDCAADVPVFELVCVGSALTLLSFQAIYHIHRTYYYREVRKLRLGVGIVLSACFLSLPWIPCIKRTTVVACTLAIWVAAIFFHGVTDDLLSFNDSLPVDGPRADVGIKQGYKPEGDSELKTKKEVVEESHRLLRSLKYKAGSQANASSIMRSSRNLISDLRHRTSSVSSVTRALFDGPSQNRTPNTSARGRTVNLPPLVPNVAAGISRRVRSLTDIAKELTESHRGRTRSQTEMPTTSNSPEMDHSETLRQDDKITVV